MGWMKFQASAINMEGRNNVKMCWIALANMPPAELRHLIERMARTVSHATCTVDDEPAGQ